MRYLNENKILLEEPEDDLEVVDIENTDEEDTKEGSDVEPSNELKVAEEPIEDNNEEQSVQPEASQDELDSGISSMINGSIVSTWNRIDEFTGMIATVKSYDSYKNIETILQSILDDEMIHIGQLQKALSLVSSSEDLISQGIERAEETINSPETDDSSEDKEDDDEIIDDEEEAQSEPNTDEIEDVEDETSNEDEEESEDKENDEDVKESLDKVQRWKINCKSSKEIKEMLKQCELTILKEGINSIVVKGKTKDLINASGMLDIPMHKQDLF